jgi:spore coat polysaccharide biosynthesis protein SpsF
MKTGIIIQARMSSTRLPGKVLLPLAGRPVIWHDVERCRQAAEADLVIVATSTEPSDDSLVAYLTEQKIPCWRGPLENVLARYYGAAKHYELEIIVRITADCPLIEPTIIDQSIKLLKNHLAEGVEYVSNIAYRIFPRGLDSEAFTFSTLARAQTSTAIPLDLEAVTPYLMRTVKYWPQTVADDWRGNERLTLDEPRDYELLKQIYDHFYQPNKIIDTRQVLDFLRKPSKLIATNQKVAQKHDNTDDALFRQNPHYIDIYRKSR